MNKNVPLEGPVPPKFLISVGFLGALAARVLAIFCALGEPRFLLIVANAVADGAAERSGTVEDLSALDEVAAVRPGSDCERGA